MKRLYEQSLQEQSFQCFFNGGVAEERFRCSRIKIDVLASFLYFDISAPSPRSLEIAYGRLYGNSNGKLRGDRGDRGDRDRPDRTLLYPGDRDDRVKFVCDHMETTPGDSSDWEDRNVSQYALFRDQNSLFSLTLSKWRRAAIISTPPYLWKKSKNMNVYTINFVRITKISPYG